MGMLIAVAVIALGGLAIHGARTHQWALAILGTVGSYYALVGGAWAFFLMESDNRSLTASLKPSGPWPSRCCCSGWRRC